MGILPHQLPMDWPAALSGVQYYGGRADLDQLIADPAADITEVVKLVERMCDREAAASTYYREHPELLEGWHPWLEFVRSGSAAYLGWQA